MNLLLELSWVELLLLAPLADASLELRLKFKLSEVGRAAKIAKKALKHAHTFLPREKGINNSSQFRFLLKIVIHRACGCGTILLQRIDD